MKEYFGTREFGATEVFCRSGNGDDTRPLAPRNDLADHSSDGFEWGYGGSGPAQLALAILADALGDDFALALYQRFKFEFVHEWPQPGWSITEDEIRRWAHRQQVVQHHRDATRARARRHWMEPEEFFA